MALDQREGGWNLPGILGKGLGSAGVGGQEWEAALDLGKGAESCQEFWEKGWKWPWISGKGLGSARDQWERGWKLGVLETGNSGNLEMLESWAVLGVLRIPKFQIQAGDVADGIPRLGMNPDRE